MDDISKLRNTGFYAVNDDHRSNGTGPATVVVFGTPRSGTSAVSGVLHHLGLFMGDEAHSPVYEDHRMSSAVQSGSWHQVEEVIGRYNNEYERWGYKRPDLLRDTRRLGFFGPLVDKMRWVVGDHNCLPLYNFGSLNNRLRNPRYIITYRDAFAVANRNRISMNADLLESMETVLSTYQRVTKLIKKYGLSVLLISLEKAVNDKEMFVDQLIKYCGLQPTAAQRQKALGFVTKDPKKYLDVTRSNKSIGYLEKAGVDGVVGWARYVENERVALVDLYINDHKVATAKADIFREDLLSGKIHSSGSCSFAFTEFDRSLLESGCKVRVRATEDTEDVENSPLVL